jgi:hypothetical protein
MTTYYLIPQTVMRKQAEAKGFDLVPADLITTFEGTAKKAREAARLREKELNDGIEHSTEEAAKRISDADAAPLWFVTPEPSHTARSYRTFKEWPCNREIL